MESNNSNNSTAPVAGKSHLSMRTAVTLLAVMLVLIGILYAFQISMLNKSSTTETESSKAAFDAYTNIAHSLEFAEGNPGLISALETFRDIASNEQNRPIDRVRGLNGINYAYTLSNFNADDVYNVVFSKPPYSQYYVAPAPTETAVDPFHPENGAKVKAVEAAILKLNELSNAIYPNHYAISRLEVGNVFAYQREAANAKPSEIPGIQAKYAGNIKALVSSYDTLPALESVSSYAPGMRYQIMFAHASAVAWVGNNMNDTAYQQKGEDLFKKAIAAADAFPPNTPGIGEAINQSLLARIFYASYYWRHYKNTDPDVIKDVLRPLTSNNAQDTAVYKVYIPSHKDSRSPQFAVLREVAAQMPELKTYLEGRGWKF